MRTNFSTVFFGFLGKSTIFWAEKFSTLRSVTIPDLRELLKCFRRPKFGGSLSWQTTHFSIFSGWRKLRLEAWEERRRVIWFGGQAHLAILLPEKEIELLIRAKKPSLLLTNTLYWFLLKYASLRSWLSSDPNFELGPTLRIGPLGNFWKEPSFLQISRIEKLLSADRSANWGPQN